MVKYPIRKVSSFTVEGKLSQIQNLEEHKERDHVVIW